VWTTLGICWTWSYDAAGNVQLPTREQQRFMIYDAILNGARAIAFYGGQNSKCWGQLDAAGGWNWTYWERVLEPLRSGGEPSRLRSGIRNDARAADLDRSVRAISTGAEQRALGDRGAGGDEGSRRHDRRAPGRPSAVYAENDGADRRWRAGRHLRPLVRSRVPPDGVDGPFQLIVGQVRAPPELKVAPAESVITPGTACG
jgi:hypothetical protein